MKFWLQSVRAALDLLPEHLSLYALALEHGTPMQNKVEQGILHMLDEDLAADMYDAASEILATAGFIQYEISNWAREKNSVELYSCIHNLQYWRNLPYIGVGAGAHGYINHFRTVDVYAPGMYIKKMKNGNESHLDRWECPRSPATIEMTPVGTSEIGRP
jgi:oxygen-independent coproporphyrinogen-3 oxidase